MAGYDGPTSNSCTLAMRRLRPSTSRAVRQAVDIVGSRSCGDTGLGRAFASSPNAGLALTSHLSRGAESPTAAAGSPLSMAFVLQVVASVNAEVRGSLAWPLAAAV